MKIVYRVTEEDFMEARKLFVKNEKRSRRLARGRMPWLGVLLLLAAVILMFGHNLIEAAFLALMGVYSLYCGFALNSYFRKLYRNDPRYKNDITADISEDGIRFVTPTVDSQIKWSGVIRFLESEKIFMLFYAAWSFTVIPKNAFAPGEIDAFRDLLRREVSARASSLSVPAAIS